MPQASINLRNCKAECILSRRSKSTQLASLLFLLVELCTIICGGWQVACWMKEACCLPLSRLVITGERNYTTNDDIRQSILALGTPGTFMTQDVNVIQQQIKRLPWIKQAQVRKQWPDKLQIYLLEYVPVAYWNDVLIVDKSGKLFSMPMNRLNKHAMPMLYGPENSEQDVLASYSTMNTVLAAAQLPLKVVSMTARHSWQLTLQGNIRIDLGRHNRAMRLQRFVMIYPLLNQQAKTYNKRINYVDMRYSTGFAVGWASEFIDADDNNQQQN